MTRAGSSGLARCRIGWWRFGGGAGFPTTAAAASTQSTTRRTARDVCKEGAGLVAPYTVMTTLPRAWPCLMYRMASGTALSG